jgi:hypothetical protein
MRKWGWLLAAVVLFPGVSSAEMSRELRNAIAAAGDDPANPADVKRLQRDFQGSPSDPGNLARAGIAQDEAGRARGKPRQKNAPDAPETANGCTNVRRLFVRNDKLDIDTFSGKSDAKGAAVSYTDDRVGGVQTADIHAVVSYAFDHECLHHPMGYGLYDAYVSRTTFAPFVLANGTLSNDRSTEKSALQFGFDSRATVFSGPLFNYQIFTLSPYYQTDFRGEASVYGASASWEPYQLAWRLGGNVNLATPWLDYYWQLKAEVDSLHVNKAGLTNFTNGTDYAFWGGTAKLLLFPFPDQLQRRVIAIAEYSYYWESQAQQDVRLFVGTLAYNITEDGSTSISGQYKKGTEKQTLKQLDQYLLSFNYKY